MTNDEVLLLSREFRA